MIYRSIPLFFISQHKKGGSQHHYIETWYMIRYNDSIRITKEVRPMRIAICDDEKNIRELIGNKVEKNIRKQRWHGNSQRITPT